MNESDLANKIVLHLNQGLGTIKEGTLYQLRTARQAALDRYHEAPRPVFGLAWAGDIASGIGHNRYLNGRNLLALGLLVLSLIGVTYWQFVSQAPDVAEVDASLLTDELPINAYLDSNFEAWLKLKRSSQ